MSQFSPIQPNVVAQAAPAPDTSAVARGIAAVAGGTSAIGQFMAQDAAQLQQANLSATVNEARVRYARGLQSIESGLEEEADPEAMRRRFVDDERTLRSEVLDSVAVPDQIRRELAVALDDMGLPTAARVKTQARRRTIERSAAARQEEMTELVRRGSLAGDPAELHMARTRLRELVEMDVDQGLLPADQGQTMLATAIDAIDRSQLDRAVQRVGRSLVIGNPGDRRLAERVAEVRQEAERLGIDRDAINAMMGGEIVQAAGELATLGKVEQAVQAVRNAGDIELLSAADTQSIVSEIMKAGIEQTKAPIYEAMRMIRSGRGDIEGITGQDVLAMIDAAAPIVGEKDALTLTVQLNEALGDNQGRLAAQARLAREAAGRAGWVNSVSRDVFTPGLGGMIDLSEQTVMVDGVETVLSPAAKGEALAEFIEGKAAEVAQAAMSEDPVLRSAALAEVMPEMIPPSSPLSEDEAAALEWTIRMRGNMRSGNVDESLRQQLKQVARQGVASIEAMVRTGNAPEDSAFERLYLAYTQLSQQRVVLGDYLSASEQAVLQEIDRQYRFGANAGEFWPSALAAAESVARRAERGERLSISEDDLDDAMLEATRIGFWTANASWVVNRFADVGDVVAYVSGLWRPGQAGNFGTFGRLPTEPEQRIQNMSQVRSFLRSTIEAVAESSGDVESATALAVERFRQNHLIINRRAVYTGTEAISGSVQQVHAAGLFDRVVDEFWAASGGLEEIGVEKDDLELRPVVFGNPDRWQIVDATTGAAVGNGELGVDRFDIAALYKRAIREQAEKAAARSLSRQQLREKLDRMDPMNLIGSGLRPLLPGPSFDFIGGEGEIRRPLGDDELDAMQRWLNGEIPRMEDRPDWLLLPPGQQPAAPPAEPGDEQIEQRLMDRNLRRPMTAWERFNQARRVEGQQ